MFVECVSEEMNTWWDGSKRTQFSLVQEACLGLSSFCELPVKWLHIKFAPFNRVLNYRLPSIAFALVFVLVVVSLA